MSVAKFTKEDVRTWTLKVLALIANLTRQQRGRVLRHALKTASLSRQERRVLRHALKVNAV